MESNANYVLITGGTSGIGYELAKLFAQDGYNLIIVARDVAELEKVAVEFNQQYKVNVVKISTDLFNPQNAFALYDKVKSKRLEVSILVNDAGQGLYGEFIDTDIQRELDIIHLNISSLIILTKKFLQDMVSRGEGKILNLASVASKMPGPLQSVYYGTKAFVHSFSESIREEVKDKGVTITSLLPGATNTDFFNKADMLDAKNIKEGMKEGKLADPAHIAKAGYDALMAGDDMVVPGLKNKMRIAMSNLTPDSVLAEQSHKQHAPSSEK